MHANRMGGRALGTDEYQIGSGVKELRMEQGQECGEETSHFRYMMQVTSFARSEQNGVCLLLLVTLDQ